MLYFILNFCFFQK